MDFFGNSELGVQITGAFASIIEDSTDTSDSESPNDCHMVWGTLLCICMGLGMMLG